MSNEFIIISRYKLMGEIEKILVEQAKKPYSMNQSQAERLIAQALNKKSGRRILEKAMASGSVRFHKTDFENQFSTVRVNYKDVEKLINELSNQ